MRRFLRTLRDEAPSLQVGGTVVLLVAAALLFAVSDSGRLVASDVATAQQSEAVLGAVALVNSATREALIVAQAGDHGIASLEVVEEATAAIAEASEHLETQGRLLAETMGDRHPDDGGRVMFAVEAVSTAAAAVTASLQDGNIQDAVEHAVETLEPAGLTLADVATQIRERNQEHVSSVQRDLGRVATATRFMVAFIAPAIVVWLIFRAMRRRQRAVQLRSELARERELHQKKNSFLAAASHQIKTPLSTVVGYAELLRDSSRDFSAGVRQEMIEIMADQSRETAHVVDDILVAGRSDFGELLLVDEEVDVRALVESAISGLGSGLRSHLVISGNATVQADRRWTSQIVRNLLRNAANFGGENILVSISRSTRMVAVAVSDDGPGLDGSIPEDALFNAYYDYRQLDGGTPTMGLGLSVARTLARHMGGDLTYTRLDGRSTFELTLPVGADTPVSEPLPDLTVDPLAGLPTPAAVAQVIANGGPEIVYQPIVDLGDYRHGHISTVGFEALARFEYGRPNEWFDTARSAGLLLDLDLACVTNAVNDFPAKSSNRFLAVNVNDVTLMSTRLLEALHGADLSRVIVELSESASIKSYEETVDVVRALRDRGVRLALDDVGSGEIDMWHVIRLEPALIKIDASLVRDLEHSPENRALIRALATAASELGMLVICEGIETDVEAATLLGMGIKYGQGNLFGEPGSHALDPHLRTGTRG